MIKSSAIKHTGDIYLPNCQSPHIVRKNFPDASSICANHPYILVNCMNAALMSSPASFFEDVKRSMPKCRLDFERLKTDVNNLVSKRSLDRLKRRQAQKVGAFFYTLLHTADLLDGFQVDEQGGFQNYLSETKLRLFLPRLIHIQTIQNDMRGVLTSCKDYLSFMEKYQPSQKDLSIFVAPQIAPKVNYKLHQFDREDLLLTLDKFCGQSGKLIVILRCSEHLKTTVQGRYPRLKHSREIMNSSVIADQSVFVLSNTELAP